MTSKNGPTLASSAPQSLTSFDLALYALVVFVWGTSWIGMRWQVGVVAPEVSVLWRFVLAFPLMFAWAWAAGARLSFAPSTHIWFAAMGATMFSTNLILFYNASLAIPTGLMAVVFSLASIFNVALSAIFFGHRIDLKIVLAGIVGVTGVGLMFAPEIQAHELNQAAITGLLQCVAATASFCLGNILSAASQKRGLPMLSATAWGMLYGAIILFVFALARGQAFVVEWNFRYLGALVWLAVIASVIAFAAFLTLVGRTGAARAGYMTILFPVVALAVSTVAEGYRWTPLAVLGLALVVAGNIAVLRGPRG